MNDIKESYSILFVEDEKEIRENYVKYLDRHFQSVYEAADGEEGFNIYKNKKPDIMIVDINLPKLNGLDLVRRIRDSDYTTKVIMLTAHSEINYLLEAIELKLTKYLIKPISRSELRDALSLVVAELSRFNTTSKKSISLGDNFSWDFDKEELFNSNTSVLLTNKEKAVLKLFLFNINNTYSYDFIIGEIWDDCDDSRVNALKTIIKNLRKKLPKDIIKNVFGIGYKINI